MSTAHRNTAPRRGPPIAALLLLGIGLGGLLDGILLGQILRWHHLLSATGDHPTDTVTGLEANVRADGLFLAGAWLCAAAGTALVLRAWRAGRIAPPWSMQLGMVLVGWGALVVVEGVIDHHVLGVHHLRDDVDDPLWWDLGWLAVGALLVIAGAALALRRPRPRRPPRIRAA